MKKSHLLLFCLIFIFVKNISAKEFVDPKVAVIKSQFDHIEVLLDKYKVPYDFIEKHRKLEAKELYENYDVLFLPCGIEASLKTNMNLLARGTQLEGLSISEKYYSLDEKLTGELLNSFIKKGGTVYFSDLSCKYLQSALNCVKYYKNFPYMGMQGWIDIHTEGELYAYFAKSIISLYIKHDGWVVPAEIIGGQGLMRTLCETPLGVKNAVLGSIIPHGNGEAIYSGFHEDKSDNDIMRFLLFRTVYSQRLKETKDYIKSWEQKGLTTVVDRSLPHETHRKYKLNLANDEITFYFFPSGGTWQIDFYDKQGLIFYSENNIIGDFRVSLSKYYGSSIFVKIFNLDQDKYHVYTASTASGERILPYLRISLYVIGSLLIVILLFFILKGKRFVGRNM